ncbi:TIR domain-containing protein [Arthrobacter sp. 135MFCol5.1]|uniref:TIR domain-containing protein n=1 Tax=Arthrobacter sp. 135MFCol5.1 TaxID=1158050 RepID=UPI0009DA6540|nr:TIR domain-containing protein [Arthrobacter sp. 135MFCol5.1]
MKIFISWSGTPSHEMALLLREWLVRVLQYSEPFVSSKDISKGAQWLVTISEQLTDTTEGIVCVTPSNVEAPWLNYEAGALAKTTGQTAVRTVLLGLGPGDLPAGAPLSNFQHTDGLDPEEMWSLVESIHLRSEAAGASLERIRWAFDQAWPELKASLETIELHPEDNKPDRSPDEQSLIKDVLQEVKSISMAVAALGQAQQPPRKVVIDSAEQSSRVVPANDRKTVSRVTVGTRLHHQSFGEGIVLLVEGAGDKKIAHTQFDNGEKKRLLLRYAPVAVLD